MITDENGNEYIADVKEIDVHNNMEKIGHPPDAEWSVADRTYDFEVGTLYEVE